MGLMKLAEASAHKYGRQFMYVDMNHSHLHLDEITGGNDQRNPEAVIVVKAGRKLYCFMAALSYDRKTVDLSRVPEDFSWKYKLQAIGGLIIPRDGYLTKKHIVNFNDIVKVQANYNYIFAKDGTLK